MSKINGSIDLAILPGAQIVNKKGRNWLIIDLDKTEAIKLHEKKDGDMAAYTNISVASKKEIMYGKSHYIEASLTKEEREAGAERRYLGNLTEVRWDDASGKYVNAHESTAQTTSAPAPAPVAPSFDDDDDDLPF